MVVNTVSQCESVSEDQAIQHLAYRGYRLVEQIAARPPAHTYVVQDNRQTEGCYCLVRVSPSPETSPLTLQTAPSAAFEIDGYRYVVRPYINGSPLTWEIPTTGWDPTQVVNLLKTVLTTLNQYHQHEKVHGNLHPNNIIRQPDGSLVFTDPTAERRESHSPVSPPLAPLLNGLDSNVLGRFGHHIYGAPEPGPQFPSGDIYSVGVLGIQFLLGRQAWASPEQLTQLLSGVPHPPLVAVLQRMVDPYPGQRYINAQAALFALDNLQQSSQPQPAPPTVPDAAPLPETVELRHQAETTDVSAPDFAPPEPDLAPSERPAVLGQTSALATTQPDNSKIPEPVELIQALTHRPMASLSDRCSPEPTPMLAAQPDPLLISGTLQTENNSLPSRSLKWTPAVLALTASIGGLAWYHQQVYGEQGVAIASDTLAPEQQDTEPLPVPASPSTADASPKFSQSQADHYFARAYHHAKARDFSKALVYLEQVPEDSDRYLEAQAKITEYQTKREIKARALLVSAYNLAASRNFAEALTYLHQIPAHTDTHRIALEKITEYRTKQQIKADSQASLG
ncbi:MAG: hypothetical protein AAFY17_05310 [Cyanobacteria bacterium J06642_11]